MDAAEVLDRVLEDHRTLHVMASRVDVLADRLLQGRYRLAKELREQMKVLDKFFRQHLELEERVLVPALLECCAWGPERVQLLHEEHSRQREISSEIWKEEPGRADNILIFALLASGFVRMLREDMKAEERGSINARVLNDSLIDPAG